LLDFLQIHVSLLVTKLQLRYALSVLQLLNKIPIGIPQLELWNEKNGAIAGMVVGSRMHSHRGRDGNEENFMILSFLVSILAK